MNNDFEDPKTGMSPIDLAAICAAAIVSHEVAKVAGDFGARSFPAAKPTAMVAAMGAVYFGTAAAVYQLANKTKASPYHRQ